MEKSVLFLSFCILSGCTMGTKVTSIDNLILKTIEYKYGENIYHVTFDSHEILHWEAMAGDEKGVKANEKYKAEIIDGKLFITWSEENGIGVSQILDFERGVVHNHLIKGRDVSIGNGLIRVMP